MWECLCCEQNTSNRVGLSNILEPYYIGSTNRLFTLCVGVKSWGLIWTHELSFGRPFVQSDINCMGGLTFFSSEELFGVLARCYDKVIIWFQGCSKLPNVWDVKMSVVWANFLPVGPHDVIAYFIFPPLCACKRSHIVDTSHSKCHTATWVTGMCTQNTASTHSFRGTKPGCMLPVIILYFSVV